MEYKSALLYHMRIGDVNNILSMIIFWSNMKIHSIMLRIEFLQSQNRRNKILLNFIQEKQIQLIFQQLLIQPQYKYERKLIWAGLHQFIQTKIVFNKQSSQNIVILDELETFTYADKGELNKLSYEAKLITIVDIERPNELSTQNIIQSKHKGEIEIWLL